MSSANRVSLLIFQSGFLLFPFILWMLWLKLPNLCWIVVVRVGTLVFFLTFIHAIPLPKCLLRLLLRIFFGPYPLLAAQQVLCLLFLLFLWHTSQFAHLKKKKSFNSQKFCYLNFYSSLHLKSLKSGQDGKSRTGMEILIIFPVLLYCPLIVVQWSFLLYDQISQWIFIE